MKWVKKFFRKISPTAWAVIVAFILIIALVIYMQLGFRKIEENINGIKNHIAIIESDIASTTISIRSDTEKNLLALSSAINTEKQNVGAIEKKLGTFQQEVGTVSSTVNTLQKLSKTDPELLQKYSKVFFLNEHYSPPRLTEIPDSYEYSESRTLKIHTDVWPYLQKLVDDASKAGVTIYIFSAFRSFNEQNALKSQYTVTYGSGTANQFSADQGYSEHQLGTTIDFITTGLNGQLDGFDKTKAYEWLLANAHKYGFVLSYPDGNKFYVFEPWHWRYVGVKLATDLFNAKAGFYDWDQRKIDEYLVNVF